MENSNQRLMRKIPVKPIILGAVLLFGGLYAWKKISFAMHHETTDNAQVETLLVPVLPRVGGYVKTISISDYDSVKTGQVVVELDDAEIQAQLLQLRADEATAEADLTNAKAALNNARVSLSVNRGNIDIAQVRVEKSQKDYNRDKNLLAESAITQRQMDDTKFNLETSTKQLQNSRNDLASAESRIGVLEAAVKKSEATIQAKKAMIAQQELRLSYTKVMAPVGGKIGRKNVSEGQLVNPGTPICTIVNDSAYWIVANFKEGQIRRLHPGIPVDIEVDAYPDLKLKGKVESLSDATGARFALLPPDNASGNFVKVTQRIPVRISIDDQQKYRDILRAGMSVFVSITIDN
jgi:membrane fusion protein (multidrug efflux system)